jgi:integrase
MKKTKLPRGLTWDAKREQYRIQFVSKHSKPGKHYNERLPPGTSKRQAETYLNKLREEDRLGVLLWASERKDLAKKQDLPTFQEFVEDSYIPHIKRHSKKSTIRSTISSLKSICSLVGHNEIDLFDDQLLAEFQDARLDQGVRRSTVNKGCVNLVAVLRHAEKNGLIQKIPKYKKLTETDRKEHKILTVEEATRALAYALEKGTAHYCLTLFLLHTGSRWSETRLLTWDKVDLDGGMVMLPRRTAKSDKARYVPLCADLVDALRELPQEREHVFTYHSSQWKRWVLFPHNAHIGGLAYPWQGPDKDCSWGPHTYRHTFATWKLEAGVPLSIVSDWMGHSSIAITHDIYGHIRPKNVAGEIERGPMPKLG